MAKRFQVFYAKLNDTDSDSLLLRLLKGLFKVLISGLFFFLRRKLPK